MLRDSNYSILIDINEHCQEWDKYIEKLFKSDKRPYQEQLIKEDENRGLLILIAEVKKLLNNPNGANKIVGQRKYLRAYIFL